MVYCLKIVLRYTENKSKPIIIQYFKAEFEIQTQNPEFKSNPENFYL